ncbi:hypothetical protein [Jeongeupia chitinilytica]|uniref:Uncharacterized protein n=1 Tax=Jeongeupia chitinilytica TaxID=1041641 RepID=A0ABQ3H2N8_9NEIS|nr:hypothetical protein [Jeongeupia chitinilytica]GHD64416.1 hypothetical protein GCM10007350_23590 [Jeongeupia chitinilytica]
MPLAPADSEEAKGGSVWINAHTAGTIYQLLLTDQNHFTGKYCCIINDIRKLYRIGALATLNETQGGSLVFKGGHVEVADRKMFYTFWRALVLNGDVKGGSRQGASSHQSDDEQFEILFPNRWGNLLFGTRNGGTWFQTEAYGFTDKSWWNGSKDSLGHASTTVQHYATKWTPMVATRQVGTCGYSTYTEKEGTQLRVPFGLCPNEPD